MNEGLEKDHRMKGAKRIPVLREERAGPTLETVLKARTHAVDRLPPEYQLAAIAIEEGYGAIVRGLLPRAASLAPKTSPGPREMTDDESNAADAYLGWAKEMTARKLPLDIVIEIVVDGIPPERIDNRFQRPLNEPWAAQKLIEALELFNRMGK